ncbi:alpha/beta fold hydrolase [Mesobacillus maritimus]|uniref:alpha/beta fold hydrolase n=1 Tax=Mesobacillus maritimus TaxID=1643336 RepID=UPI002040717D|nr:alpha/beta fold hydrolase [Mesobacillus maritimus]MCM3669093.1 alpha/beta fold hydrolase [Mesobacillus maritimus]
MADFPRKRGTPRIIEQSEIPVGPTPRKAIWRKNKATLWYYPAAVKKKRTPMFLIYSLVNQAFILDLAPGASMIEGFTEQGYDVYLLDFGIPGYEDKNISLADYIFDYIQPGARRALWHSKAEDLTVIGYCLGGTLAVMYAAIATEPIKNLILFAAPIDFKNIPYMSNWHQALREGGLKPEGLIDEYGVVPAQAMEFGLRLMTAPINVTPYLALLGRMNDKKYIEKWRKFDKWVKGHVPFAGTAFKELLHEMVVKNKLIKNKLYLRQKKVNLKDIKANLLVVSTEGDDLIPEEMVKPLVKKVSSRDKTYLRVKGGHVTLAIRGGLPEFLTKWLDRRS